MPCEFTLNQRVRSNVTGKMHTITGIRRDPPREILAGWGMAIIEDVFIQVDNQRGPNGEKIWYCWGNFKALTA